LARSNGTAVSFSALVARHPASQLPLLPAAFARGAGGLGYLGFPVAQVALSAATYSVRPFRGPQTTLDRMSEDAMGPRGQQSMEVRQFTEHVVRAVQPKDYLGEILVIRNVLVQPSPWVRGIALFRYANDPRHTEMVKDPQRQVEEINAFGSTVVDCDDIATMAAAMCLSLGRAVQLVAMGFEPGRLSHVAICAQEPKTSKWILLDGVAGPREAEAAGRAKNLHKVTLD
jgi:hypothetical protein